MTDKEKQAIERLKQIDETTEEYDGNLFKKDFEKVLNLIEKQQKETEKYKYLYQKALDNTIKADRENLEKDKIIDLMAKRLVGIIFSDKDNIEIIFDNKEDIKDYFKKKVEDK